MAKQDLELISGEEPARAIYGIVKSVDDLVTGADVHLPSVLPVSKCQIFHRRADHLMFCGLALFFSQPLIPESIIFEWIFEAFGVDSRSRGTQYGSLRDESSIRECEWDQGFSRQGS